MGYYTTFTLNCYDNHANSFDISFETDSGKALTAALHEINPGYFDDDFDLKTLSDDYLKWYDHDEDMVKLSIRFPDYTFILEGEGEENGDLWRTIYHDGQLERLNVKIVYEKPRSDFAKIVYDIYDDVEKQLVYVSY